MKNLFTIISVLVCLLTSFISAGTENRDKETAGSAPAEAHPAIRKSFPITIPRINGKVVLDGINNESAWNGIEPFMPVQFKPVFMAAPSEKTEMYMAYDDENLYVAGRFYVKDPSHIHSNIKKRDTGDDNTDWFGIVIDSFNDKENVMTFCTSPAGARWDATVTNDGNSFADMNKSWNTHWEAATTVTDEGWFAEIRIPFSSLRFNNENGRVIMGINLRRNLTEYDNEEVTYPAISPDYGLIGIFKASLTQEVMFEGIKNHNPVYFSPYLLSGKAYNHSLNSYEDSYNKNKHSKNEMGFDLKYNITSKMTLDVTANTDFAQVEADYQQANLTRYSLFFPEKRMFFQERANVFNFNFESSYPNRLFHSRSIGIKDGKAVRIIGGARLVGKIGDWDLGVLNMQTDKSGEHPGENFGVIRWRRQAQSSLSYIGGMVTSRMSRNGTYNRALGVDGVFKLFHNDYFTFKIAQTYDSELNNKVMSFDPVRVRLNWGKRGLKGFGYGASYSRAGKDYNPGMGYEMRDNYSYYGLGLWYGWRPGDEALLYQHRLTFGGKIYQKNSNGIVESASGKINWVFETKSQFEGVITPIVYYENIETPFTISDRINIPEGEHTFGGLKLYLCSPTNKAFFTDVTLESGSFYDGWKNSAWLYSRINLFSSLQLNYEHQYNQVKISKRDEELNSHISRLGSMVMFNTKFSLLGLLQYSNTSDVFTSNIKFRYNHAEGIDLYLVYNENLNTDRFQIRPTLPISNDRTLLMKFVYTMGI